MRQILAAFVMLVSGWGFAPAQELFPLQAISEGGGDVHVVQSQLATLYPQYPDLTNNYTLPINAVAPGDAIFGAALYEENKGNGTSAGILDTVMVGSQAAVIDDDASQCCGPHMVTFHLLHVQNPATGITISSSTGGNFINETIQFAEIAGLPNSAAIDAHAAQFFHLPAGGPFTSPTITPTAPGDFLYGAAFDYDFNEPLLAPGPGWTTIATCATYLGCGTHSEFDPAEQYQLYGSTNPVAALFSYTAGYASNEAWAGIIAVKVGN